MVLVEYMRRNCDIVYKIQSPSPESRTLSSLHIVQYVGYLQVTPSTVHSRVQSAFLSGETGKYNEKDRFEVMRHL